MTELSPSARKVLEDAAARKGEQAGFLFVNSGGLLGGPAIQVRRSLINAGLIEAVPFNGNGDLFDGKALRITDAGRAAIGAKGGQKAATQAQTAAAAPQSAASATTGRPSRDNPATRDAARAKRGPRENSKQAKLLGMLQRPEGATIEEMANAFGWKPHTTRAAISTLPKKAGCAAPTNEKVEGRGRVYRIAEATQ